MADKQATRFGWYKIVTDEFAITEEKYAPSDPADMRIDLLFNMIEAEKLVTIKAKCLFYQADKILLVIAVSCIFNIHPDDWEKMFDAKTRILTLSLPAALQFASLSVSTTRGVLHARTETAPLNSIILPPVNLNELVKEPISISAP
jgi:hypothetical protein